MLDLRLVDQFATDGVLALPVTRTADGPATIGGASARPGIDAGLRIEIETFLAEVDHRGTAGTVHTLARPTRSPRLLYLVGIGDGDEAGWRSAGAALARAAAREPELTVVLPADGGSSPDPLVPDVSTIASAVAEGLWLAAYRYRLGADEPESAPRLRAVTLAPATLAPASGAVLTRTRTIAEAVYFARDLTNTPSDRKTPAWLAAQIAEAGSAIPNLSAAVNGPDWLAERGFGGILAVARGSAHEPRLVTLRWEPAGASRHIVLIGKGVTFDTGGIVIKPRDSMKLMRKDMGAAAAVVAATIGAAALRLPVRVTTLAPLAENAIGADAFRPGDVIRHFGGVTSEILNTDAEGRLLLGDALAYAAADLDPDVIVDLGTLTGAQSVALGKRTAALFSHDDALAAGLTEAAVRAGESVWRMPLADEYTERMDSDIADLTNSVESGGGGCITAALYLRELVGEARDRWAHLDMSAPAWSDSASGELAKGATGWGVRTLISWLSALGE